MSQNQVSCKLDRYFKNPLLFVPERWMKGDPAYEKTHPYLVLPFGHGPRACIARRLAEQNLYILLARVRGQNIKIVTIIFNSLLFQSKLQLVKRFSIEWNGAELDVKSQLINRPDAPLKFNFIERRDC